MTASVLRRSRPAPPCPCGQRCGVLSGFCDAHAARLAVMRDDLGFERHARSRDGRRLRSARVGVCCRPECFEPRALGEPFCAACGELGYEDGIGE